ncbi:VgrG protein [hydrothermal vent metagenome]|uniref:VgrG protein n=1 Tax=hydrothermal vent metagenome TaxID=652676 RepID=A0A3B0XTG1_9ZZZZ
MSDLTQDNRLISISTPLGKDELLLTSFEGTEEISELFQFQIEVLSSNHKITPDKLIGKTVTLTIQTDQKRTFNGYISQFTYGEVKGSLRTYRLVMVPWLWFLSKNNNNRIFQEKNTKDIVSSIFRDLGFNDFDYKATGNPAPREYCVQYNETDLNFIARLLEEDGIAYYFEQKGDKHKMHIVDAVNAYQECAETNLTYSKGNQPNTQINSWEHLYEFRKGKWSLDDYDFKKPKSDQFQSTVSTSEFANAKKYEHYEYTPYHDFSGIKDLSKKRIEAEEVPMNTIAARSDCSSFYAGGKFKLSKHTISEEKGNYVIIAIHHRVVDNSYQSSSESEFGYTNKFICIPDSVYYRPQLTHQKPVMPGPQSAVVVGAAGEEIYVDKDKRIKVQFHWDRLGKKDEKSTCYIRVMQPWAGAGWGTSFIPRIGMEVVVNFFDGDPDRPVITGSVYNGDNKPPFESKTQSGIKTRSTKKGTSANYNELRFDDLKDSEQIFIHAEKNMDTEVENDETLTVDNDRTKIIKHDENSTIENDRNKTVNNNQTETIQKNKTIKVGVNHTENVDKNMTITVMGDLKESVDGKYSENVTKAYDMQAKTITMQASDQITLRTGAASIVMKSSGDITISGSTINVKGSGNVIIKGSKVTTN